MNNATNRINKRMTDLKISQADIARATGAGKATISSWVKGDTKPSGVYATKLARYLRCNTDWLLSGIGAMNDTPKSSTAIDTPIDTERVNTSFNMQGVLPVISWVTAGDWENVDPVTLDDVVEHVPRPSHLSDRSFGLRVEGRSMMPEFKPNDIIYVEPNIAPWDLMDGDLIVIQCNDDKQATFKQLVIGDSPDDMYLRPLNPDWPDQKISPMGECRLVGIVDSKYVRYR